MLRPGQLPGIGGGRQHAEASLRALLVAFLSKA